MADMYNEQRVVGVVIVAGGDGGVQAIGRVPSITRFEESATPLGASATFTGPQRRNAVVLVAGQSNIEMNTLFTAMVAADQGGTLHIEGRNGTSGTWWRLTGDGITIEANKAVSAKVPAVFSTMRVVVINGPVAQTAMLVGSMFSNA